MTAQRELSADEAAERTAAADHENVHPHRMRDPRARDVRQLVAVRYAQPSSGHISRNVATINTKPIRSKMMPVFSIWPTVTRPLA